MSKEKKTASATKIDMCLVKKCNIFVILTFHEDWSKLSLFSGHLGELKESYVVVKFKIAFIDGVYFISINFRMTLIPTASKIKYQLFHCTFSVYQKFVQS